MTDGYEEDKDFSVPQIDFSVPQIDFSVVQDYSSKFFSRRIFKNMFRVLLEFEGDVMLQKCAIRNRLAALFIEVLGS
jgi:hypothetical protein